MLRKYFFLFLVLPLPVKFAMATEGMWIPMLLKALNESEMQATGLRLTAEDIYSVNKSSLKDAVVHFNGGCTGEMVSEEGLLFTNHHCGYSQIQNHSSVENNYLKNGFWAMNREAELPNEGLYVTFIVRMEDVTSRVLEGVNKDDDEEVRKARIRENSQKISNQAVEGTHYKATVKPFFYGSEYYMFITETFNDVRLVGAPPSAVGKFGHDKDNWVWPRHTGDFAVFRVYADQNNQPAAYSPDNVPYRPKHHLPISIRGVKEGDFSMVFGFPGTTEQYLSSYAVDYTINVKNPAKIKMRETSLSIIDADMASSEKINLMYAAKQSRISNGYKKWIGQNFGLKQKKALQVKQQREKEFIQLATQKGREDYVRILSDLKALYQKAGRFNMAREYLIEYFYMGPEILRFSKSFANLILRYEKLETNGKLEAEITRLKAKTKHYFKNYNPPTDKKVFAALTSLYYHGMDKELLPAIFAETIMGKYKGDFQAYADMVFENSVFDNETDVLAMLDGFGKKQAKKLKKDPAFQLAEEVSTIYSKKIRSDQRQYTREIARNMRLYVAAIRDLQPDKRFWADANSTLRLAYGKIEGSSPRDGMSYKHFTTLDGILEKYIPGDRDYDVPEKLLELHAQKAYGMYGENGQLHVCFTGSNHTTGGNSGSPVINADGHLIGINFDRSWESTMSDIMFDPDICRNIAVDTRYILFIIDKLAGATHLIDEMTIIDDSWEKED